MRKSDTVLVFEAGNIFSCQNLSFNDVVIFELLERSRSNLRIVYIQNYIEQSILY